MKHGLCPIPETEFGYLCSARAEIGDEVEWLSWPPSPERAYGRVIEEVSMREFAMSMHPESWKNNLHTYLRIGRFWKCSVIKGDANA